jgi:hypothetical protein
MARARAILKRSIAEWVEDPGSDVVYAEEVEGRYAVRMRQTVRDATTVWFTVGQRSLTAEAYVLPHLEHPEGAHRLALFRKVSAEELSYVLAEIYQTIELSFRSLLRENTP